MKVSLNEIIGSISPVGETWISFDFKTKQDTNWAKKGHSVATHQEKLGGQSVMTLPSGISESFGVTENKTEIIVENKLTKVQFNKILGRIESWKVGSTELIIPGDNSLTFWRPLTDNDQSSDGPYWKRFGLDKMRTSVRSVSITKSNDSVSIETELYIAPPILNWGFMTKVIYKIFNGNIRISTCLSPQTKTEAAIPKTLPRVGWEFSIPSSFTKSQWFGLGPGESYSDKRDGVFVGLFEEDTTNFDYLYDVPQETGNRSETRQFWIGSGKNGITGSLTSKGKEHLFGFKSSNSSNIDDAKHPYEIIEGPLKLRVDYAQHGVGSAACGPGVLPPYILNTEQFEFDLDLVASHVA